MVHILLTIIYLSFISLGLPDGLLGAGWPTMHLEFQVPMSWAGAVSMLISAGTIFSSLNSDRLTRRFGAGKVTAVSVAMTAIAIFGFSISGQFWQICLWAIPYGLGAGSVDAALNNYVALHFASRHMSWLHCMWGIGASTGPYIMSFALTHGQTWNHGYRYVAIIQMILTNTGIQSTGMETAKPRSGQAKQRSGCYDFNRKRNVVHLHPRKQGRRPVDVETNHSNSRCKSSHDSIFLLLRIGTDSGAVGQQFSGGYTGCVCEGCGGLCQYVLHRNDHRPRTQWIHHDET